jgi:hypothetical protein
MKLRSRTIAFLFSLVLGAAIWALSKLFTGYVEPWDSGSPYYFIALFVAGALVGWIFPGRVWICFFGLTLGQLIFIVVFLPLGPMLMLGVLFLVSFGLLSLSGAALASSLRRRLKRLRTGSEHGT